MTYKLFFIIILSLFVVIGCDEEQASSDTEIVEEVVNESISSIPVEAMVISKKIIEHKLPLTGVLAPNRSVDLVVEVSGKVTRVKNNLGDYIVANQTLAIINDVIPESQYKQAQAQVLSAESSLSIAKANFESDKSLLDNGDISELAYNNSQSNFNTTKAQYLNSKALLSTAKKSFEDTRIKSPISGFISRKNIEYGTMAQLGSVAYRVVDLSKLKLNVSVPQEMINKVRVGGKANISISALNGNHYQGVVKRVSPQADETTGGFTVEILVSNKGSNIKAGMTAKIELLLSQDSKVLAIPEYSIVTKEDETYVYKIEDDFANLVKIDLGESVGANQIVNNGLNVGDKIVTVGMKNLGLKTKVRIEKLN